MAVTLSAEMLSAIMPHAGIYRVQLFAPIISEKCAKGGIDTPLRVAHFIAQIAHESGELRYTEELASGQAYEGRADLGNTKPGDGVLFKGRGLIQLTGRANYAAYSSASGTDYIATPERLKDPAPAVAVSVWYWNSRGLNAYADKDDIRTITRRINGGVNGLSQREAYLKKAKKVLGI